MYEGENLRHVGSIFRRASQFKVKMSPQYVTGRRKCSEDVLFTVQIALHIGLLYCHLDGMCHKAG